MKFVRIEMLFLIWAVPLFFLLFLYGMKKRRNILSRFASTKSLQIIVPGFFSNRRWIKAGLILCVLLFLSLALSGPQYGFKWQEIERKGIDIIVALDCSRSMLATDISPTRLDRAKREVYDLLAMMQGDRIGLVAFAGTAFLQCPMTLDYDAFHLFLKTLTPDFLPIGGTDISGAIAVSMAGFEEKSNSEKAIILITDGENTGSNDPVKAAEESEKAGIKLFCIGVGSGDGVPVPEKDGGFKKDRNGNIILTKLDEDTLKKMAIRTGGTYVRSVSGDMDLDAIYTNEIRGKMEATTLQSGRKQIWEDRYQWFLGFAIIALMTELFLPAYRRSYKSVGTLIAYLLPFLLLWNTICYAGPMQDGLQAYEKGEYEKALKLFIDAQLEDPDNAKILYNLGNAYYRIGDYDSAINYFKQASNVEEKQLKENAYYNLGNSEFRKENFEEAVKNYNETLKLNPKDEKAKQNLEFVRQVMAKKKEDQEKQQQAGDKNQEEQEKKESESAEKGDSSDSEQKEGEEKAQAKQNEGQQGDEEQKSSPQYGDEKPDDEQQQATQSPGEESDSGNKEENQVDEKKAGVAKGEPSEGSEESDENKQQAERILNRLKDQPGKAMIPGYRKRTVEKDW